MKFSIITPFYNNSKGTYIKDIYESIINQTHEDFEWIITDDFSTDRTKQALLNLNDNRIKYVEQKYKKELFFNPQTYANGDIVVQIDSDDKIKPKSLEVYNYFFNKYPDVLFMSSVSNYVDEKGNFQNNHLIYHENYNSCLEKKIAKDINWVKNNEPFLRVNGAWGNLQAWRNIDIDFNPYNYKNIVYMDKYRALQLEENGKYLHIPRTLYVNTSRDGSISKRPLDDKENIDDAKFFDKIKKRRKKEINSYIKDYDNIFIQSQPFLYSNFNDEKDKQKLSFINFEDFNKELLKEIYFDHDLKFNKIVNDIDYYFFQIRKPEDIHKVKNDLNKIKNCKQIVIQSIGYNFKSFEMDFSIQKEFDGKYYNKFCSFELIII